ncbi:MAG: hypothetical protein WDO74_15010 [Pseudomonadota bacterium]
MFITGGVNGGLGQTTSVGAAGAGATAGTGFALVSADFAGSCGAQPTELTTSAAVSANIE